MLHFQLDSICEAYEVPDFVSAVMKDAHDYGVPADLSDLHTTYEQDGVILRDTDVLVEYFDGDEYGFGVVTAWTTDPFDLYDNSVDEDFAFILCDNGGSTYANYLNLRPICEVNENDNVEYGNALPMWNSASISNQSHPAGQNDYGNLYELPHVTNLPFSMEVAS